MLNQLRQQLAKFWGSQNKAQRLVLIGLALALIILVPVFLVWASTPTYAVAFSGLSEADAAQIVEKLSEKQIQYQLRDSGTILVPEGQIYDARLKMASEGLPQSGTVGFELFSSNTFGMTEFTQRVTYQRALEGELERTIGSLTSIQAVRVHIVMPEKSLLSSEQAPATASITLQEKVGEHIDAAQVNAISHLVASSVEGMAPENVVIVDINGNLLASGDVSAQETLLAQTDDHRLAEQLAAREVQGKVQKFLNSVLGPNQSVVQASVSLDWTQRETTTQAYDPDEAVIRSSQLVSEVYTTTNGTLAGIPGAETNLPSTDSGLSSEASVINYSRVEKTTNYEITQVESRQIESPGEIERISLSVLVDGITNTIQLDSLRTAIGAAAGIDASRGDLLAVESLAFDRSYYEAQASELAQGEQFDLWFKIGSGVAVALLMAALFWYIQRLLSNLRLASAEAWRPILRPVSEMALTAGLPAPGEAGAALRSGAALRRALAADSASKGGQRPPDGQRPSDDQKQWGAGLRPENGMETPGSAPEGAAQPLQTREMATRLREVEPLPRLELPSITPEERQLQLTIEQLANEDPSTLAEVIQLWLKEDEKHNG